MSIVPDPALNSSGWVKRSAWRDPLYWPIVRSRKGDLGDGHLCVRCRSIDFKAIFALRPWLLPANGRAVFDLGIISSSSTHPPCPLCRLFAAMSLLEDYPPKNNHERRFHLRAFPRHKFWEVVSYPGEASPGLSPVVLALCNPAAKFQIGAARRSKAASRGIIQPLPLGKASATPGTRFRCEPLQPDLPIGRIQEMLGRCRNNHQKCRLSEATFPQAARAIDCRAREIVSLDHGVSYLALSYVWGNSTLRPEEQAAQLDGDVIRLPSKLPRTIEDAILITLALGYKYLWVDRYCIRQYHSDDKRQQINQMANIYSWSSATICALGSSDDAGIIGASQPRSSQFTVEVQGGLYTWAGREARTLLRQSLWSGRGWTLQELVLSPRCLFFTEEGVVLACREGVLCESKLRDHETTEYADLFDRECILFDEAKNWTTKHSPLQRFTLLRNEYLRRRLGFDADGLNAFRAILSQMAAPSYWGVVAMSPFEMDGDCAVEHRFAESLGWAASRQPGARRSLDEFPSWSWVSETTAIWYPGRHPGSSPDFKLDEYKPEVSAVIDVLDAGFERTLLSAHFTLHENRGIIPELSKYLSVWSVLARWTSTSHSEGAITQWARIDWTSNTAWMPLLSKFTGLAYFDSPPAGGFVDGAPSVPPEHVQCNPPSGPSALSDPGLTPCVRRPTCFPTSGYAVLLTSGRCSSGLSQRWLLIRRVGSECTDGSSSDEYDGTYWVREGVFVVWVALPPPESSKRREGQRGNSAKAALMPPEAMQRITLR